MSTQPATTSALRYLTPPDSDSACDDPQSTDPDSKMRRHQFPYDHHPHKDVTGKNIDARNQPIQNFAFSSTAQAPSTTTQPNHDLRQRQYAGQADQEAFAQPSYAGASFAGYHGDFGYGQQYGYSAYAPIQHPQQDFSWSVWQGNNSSGQYLYPTAAAQEEGFTYPSQWYAQAQTTPAAYASWGDLHYVTGYSAHQHPLTPLQDDQVPATKDVPAPRTQESVIADFLSRRLGVNKKIRSRSFKPKNAPVAVDNRKARPRRQQKLAETVTSADKDPAAPQPKVAPRKPAGRSNDKIPRLHMMQRPMPTATYFYNAAQSSQLLASPRPLLVILDLNGSLLFRKKFGGSNAFITRPGVTPFLDYVFSNHIVMVWSSARPENVAKMCTDLFTYDEHAALAAIWARDKLKLTPAAYNEKVQVYKQLSWVWSDPAINGKRAWSQADTVLIDDSVEKAASEPFNIVRIDEFEGKPEQMELDILEQVTQYLRILSWQSDVSAYMRHWPFQYVPMSKQSSAPAT